MKSITVAMIRNINKYFINKYYDEICIDAYNRENHDRHPFIELQSAMKWARDVDRYVDVSIKTLKWVCEFVENKQDYDKLGWYGDFYYKIKNMLRDNENLG